MFFKSKKTVWFYRDYRKFSGGHLKFSHYLSHISAAQNWQPKITFSKNSELKEDIWTQSLQHQVSKWQVKSGDVVFLAGTDWQYFDQVQVLSKVPVINFIQHVRHADPNLHLYQYLCRRSIRVCVSVQVQQAINDTGECNGPVYVINNGIEQAADSTTLTGFSFDKSLLENRWLLVGIKNPALAAEVSTALKDLGINAESILTPLNQKVFFNKLESAAVVVCFPNKTEGFYLPALEAMAHRKLVICPDCIGNRSFCNEQTALIPKHSLNGYLTCVKQLLTMHNKDILQLINNAQKISSEYTLDKERELFISILNDAHRIW